MSISATMVRELREKTNAGMMDCKKALEETKGDFEQAVDWLRKKGLSSASKKSGRLASEGLVDTWVSADGKTGILLEVNSETDFVARNPSFKDFVKSILSHLSLNHANDVDALLAQNHAANKSIQVSEHLKETIARIGENLVIRRFVRISVSGGAAVETYLHGEGRIGVLVEFTGPEAALSKPEFKECARNVAMHIAATNPMAISGDDVPAEYLERERKVLTDKNRESGKKEEMIAKIVDGQIKKWLSEVTLVNQYYVKNPDITVGKYLDEVAAKLGAKVQVKKFYRFELGEGLEKRADNFAAEVAAQVRG